MRVFREVLCCIERVQAQVPCLLQLARANLLGGARIRAARTENIHRAEHARAIGRGVHGRFNLGARIESITPMQ